MKTVADRLAARLHQVIGVPADVTDSLAGFNMAITHNPSAHDEYCRAGALDVAREFAKEADLAVSDLFRVPTQYTGICVCVQPNDRSDKVIHYVIVRTTVAQ